MKFRFLGTGTSTGVPMIGCDCPVCTSADKRDKRRRCGAYLTSAAGTAVLVDTPPELRLACCEYGIRRVDAIVLTHAHMDHVAAFDDVRRFNTLNGRRVECAPDAPGANGRNFKIIGKPLDCYAMAETHAQMAKIFPYISAAGDARGLFRPQIVFHEEREFAVGELEFERLEVEHGFPCCGYRVGEAGSARHLAYISDCHVLPASTLEKLREIDCLVLNCLRVREHPTHLNLEQALAYVRELRPRRTFLTHLSHDLTHLELQARLAGLAVEPAYDGLELEI